LAVGILVDDATVEIENIHRNLAEKKPLIRAILDGAQQIAVPAFVSTLAICIVFVPVLLLTGAAKYLFTPLAMAVVFAMLASYLLSRTLIPTMVQALLPPEVEIYQQGEENAHESGFIWRVHHAFNRKFERLRNNYQEILAWSLAHRGLVLCLFGLFVVGSLSLLLGVGQDFFPYVDSGQFRLHVRAPEGTRIEETERIFGLVEDEIRREIPADELSIILDNIGLPNGFSLAFSDSATIGNADGEILVALKESHGSTEAYTRQLRQVLPEKFPDLAFFFQPANITNQILNFGLPAPIDIQVVGYNAEANYTIAQEIEHRVALIPGAVDVHIHQQVNYPEVRVNVDRTKADQIGLTQRDVANSMLISLSSSGQTAPNQWLNPVNGVNYQVAVQTPQYRVDSFDALGLTPISSGTKDSAQLLSNLATLQRGVSTALVSHYNVQPVFDVYANVDERDLGSVARANAKLAQISLARLQSTKPDAVSRQQVDDAQGAFDAATANVAAAQANIKVQEANVRRLSDLQSFQKVTAPFAGIITARSVDPGALFSAGNAPNSRELFHLAQTDTLRVFVNVPQTFAPTIQPQQTAELLVREYPHRTFSGKVTRTAGALDPASRTLLTEVQVANADGALLPGMYVQVKFVIKRAEPPVIVPAAALITSVNGPLIEVVDSDDTLHYRPVQVGRDYGTEIEVVSGLVGNEMVVLNASREWAEGMLVQRKTESREKDTGGGRS